MADPTHRDLPDPAHRDLPDFHIDHREKIEWMLEQDGYAVEPVAADPTTEPPQAGYTYTIGLPDHVGFADIVVFGLTPVAARGLLGLTVDALRGGTEIPHGVEVVGLLDNDLRCLFSPVDMERWGTYFPTAASWYGRDDFNVVQLVYPDRNGFMPYEPGFDHRLRFAQPVIGNALGS